MIDLAVGVKWTKLGLWLLLYTFAALGFIAQLSIGAISIQEETNGLRQALKAMQLVWNFMVSSLAVLITSDRLSSWLLRDRGHGVIL